MSHTPLPPSALPPVDPPAHPRSLPSLVVAIIGMSCVPFLGIVGWFMASKTIREIDAEPGRYSGRDLAKVAQIVGLISVVLWICAGLYIAGSILLSINSAGTT